MYNCILYVNVFAFSDVTVISHAFGCGLLSYVYYIWYRLRIVIFDIVFVCSWFNFAFTLHIFASLCISLHMFASLCVSLQVFAIVCGSSPRKGSGL